MSPVGEVREPSRACYAIVVVASSFAPTTAGAAEGLAGVAGAVVAVDAPLAATGFVVLEDVFGIVGVVPVHRWRPLL